MATPLQATGRIGRGCVGLVVAVIAVVSVAIGATRATPAAADPIGECSATAGVLVVVDFSHWGGPTDVGCDSAPTTGYDAMSAAGFISAGTQEDGPGLICRIGLASEGDSSFEPTQSEDPCVNAPPSSAYWSYWHADPGQNTWSYSQQGAMSYHPPAGSIDAWVFGATNVSGTTGQPTFTPAQVRQAAQSGGSGSITPAPAAPATTTTAPPTTRPARAPTTAVTRTSSASRPPGEILPAVSTTVTSIPGVAGSGSDAVHSTSVATSTTTSTGPKTGAGPISATNQGGTRDGGKSVPGAPTTRVPENDFRIVSAPAGSGRSVHTTSGPPAGFIVGLAAVVVVGAAGGAVAWRRRRAT